jgi:hypothetical protein
VDNSVKGLKIAAGIIAAMVAMSVIGTWNNPKPTTVVATSGNPVATAGTSKYENGPDYVAPADHPTMTRDQQIRELQASDPSSQGYTTSDREFLAEHGVSPEQARATEQVMRDAGVQ